MNLWAHLRDELMPFFTAQATEATPMFKYGHQPSCPKSCCFRYHCFLLFHLLQCLYQVGIQEYPTKTYHHSIKDPLRQESSIERNGRGKALSWNIDVINITYSSIAAIVGTERITTTDKNVILKLVRTISYTNTAKHYKIWSIFWGRLEDENSC